MRLVAVLLIVGLIGYVGYRYVTSSPHRATCVKLASLCGDKFPSVDKCVDDVGALSKRNRASAAKIDSCIAKATSCGEGAGCLIGGGLTAAGNALKEMVEGVGRALKPR
jgi:hypothetical protein